MAAHLTAYERQALDAFKWADESRLVRFSGLQPRQFHKVVESYCLSNGKDAVDWRTGNRNRSLTDIILGLAPHGLRLSDGVLNIGLGSPPANKSNSVVAAPKAAPTAPPAAVSAPKAATISSSASTVVKQAVSPTTVTKASSTIPSYSKPIAAPSSKHASAATISKSPSSSSTTVKQTVSPTTVTKASSTLPSHSKPIAAPSSKHASAATISKSPSSSSTTAKQTVSPTSVTKASSTLPSQSKHTVTSTWTLTPSRSASKSSSSSSTSSTAVKHPVSPTGLVTKVPVAPAPRHTTTYAAAQRAANAQAKADARRAATVASRERFYKERRDALQLLVSSSDGHASTMDIARTNFGSERNHPHIDVARANGSSTHSSTTSLTSEKNETSAMTAPCPVCSKRLPVAQIDSHLDSCLSEKAVMDLDETDRQKEREQQEADLELASAIHRLHKEEEEEEKLSKNKNSTAKRKNSSLPLAKNGSYEKLTKNGSQNITNGDSIGEEEEEEEKSKNRSTLSSDRISSPSSENPSNSIGWVNMDIDGIDYLTRSTPSKIKTQEAASKKRSSTTPTESLITSVEGLPVSPQTKKPIAIDSLNSFSGDSKRDGVVDGSNGALNKSLNKSPTSSGSSAIVSKSNAIEGDDCVIVAHQPGKYPIYGAYNYHRAHEEEEEEEEEDEYGEYDRYGYRRRHYYSEEEDDDEDEDYEYARDTYSIGALSSTTAKTPERNLQTSSSSSYALPKHVPSNPNPSSSLTASSTISSPLSSSSTAPKANSSTPLTKSRPPVSLPGSGGMFSERWFTKDSELECPICFEEFKAEELGISLPCLCTYHHKCIAAWLERKQRNCPSHGDF